MTVAKSPVTTWTRLSKFWRVEFGFILFFKKEKLMSHWSFWNWKYSRHWCYIKDFFTFIWRWELQKHRQKICNQRKDDKTKKNLLFSEFLVLHWPSVGHVEDNILDFQELCWYTLHTNRKGRPILMTGSIFWVLQIINDSTFIRV